MKILKNKKATKPSEEISSNKLSVATTWNIQMDWLKENSNAAYHVMQVLGFIPSTTGVHKLIINPGFPKIDHEMVVMVLGDNLGLCEVISLLTIFSLFEEVSEMYLKVHNLVQEVIQEGCSNNEIKDVLISASKMLNYALLHAENPLDHLIRKDGANFEIWKHVCVITINYLKLLCNQEQMPHVVERSVKSHSTLLGHAALYCHISNLKSEALKFRGEYMLLCQSQSIKTNLDLLNQVEQFFSSNEFTKKLTKIISNDCSIDHSNDSMNIEELLATANDLLRRYKFEEARNMYLSLVDLESSDNFKSRVSNNLCHLLYKCNRFDEAYVYAQKKLI